MSALMTAVIFPLAFMVSPILPPIIGTAVGAVLDRMRREPEQPPLAMVEQVKARTAAHRDTGDSLPQAA